MKNNVFPIDLITIVTEKDSLNQVVEEERTTQSVFAEISSVSQTEFFSGGRLGLQPSLKAVIYDFEYNDEPIVKVHWSTAKTKLYSVYRTYAVNGTDILELYLGAQVLGMKAPSPSHWTREFPDDVRFFLLFFVVKAT